MNLQPQIFASKTHLKRYWPLNNRLLAQKNAIQNLKQNLKQKVASINDYCFVIVERYKDGQWSDQIYYVPKAHPIQTLYNRIVRDSKESYFFYTPKTHLQLGSSKTFSEIYDNYRDPDDGFIYLVLGGMNSFGG